ncbi:transcription termination/antitermination NusG family protein [Ferrimonas sp. YFM]|uniref:transcription termination/antitermination NusG family protein n=1 Tax=Ferrimonas sp. YFM TaxID=3028878 RepID=UPI002573B239|nr:transcription termination/antitermination NusG family protein [Ferrimonas sp. YFM]BDY04063.1 transcription antitermination protein RfaH [Ferrimonas sp. YFM]
MLQWYLFRVRVCSERKVSQQVEAMGFSTFLPQIQNDAKGAKLKPLFPGYLFIRLDPYQSSFSSVLRLFGMIDVVRTTGELRPVELSIVVNLRRRCKLQPQLKQPVPVEVPKTGESVVFSHGAFHEVEALFQEMSDDERCRLLVKLINRQHEIEVPLNALRF